MLGEHEAEALEAAQVHLLDVVGRRLQHDLQLQVAGDINNRGEIAGFGVLPNGDRHAFLLVPCDDKHPRIEDCDYSMMEASATASVEPSKHANPGGRLPIALWQRNNHFRFPRPVIGQTN